MNDVYEDFFKPKKTTEKGGAGSGNWGHTGLDGVWGGSDPGGGKGSKPTGGGGGESAPGGGASGKRNTHRLDNRTFNRIMANNNFREVQSLGKMWAKKYSESELRGLLKDVRRELERTGKSEDPKLEPSIYMQSLLNTEDALMLAVNYRQRGE